ncbi:MAG: alpha/beta hydrolase [Candidatus Eisenbacteria bacterium]
MIRRSSPAAPRSAPADRIDLPGHSWGGYLVMAYAAYKYTRSVNETLNADLGKFDMWPALAGFHMPTLVATGRYDINVAPSTAWNIHKAIAGSQWVVFEKSGHLPYCEEPDKFVQVMNDFLGAR